MTPVKPSPRRFLPKQEGSRSKRSSLAHEDEFEDRADAIARVKRPVKLRSDAEDQFATTPRFQKQQAKRQSRQLPPVDQAESFSLAEVLAQANKSRLEQYDPSDDDENEVMLLDAAQAPAANASEEATWTKLLTLSPKRDREEVEQQDHERMVKTLKPIVKHALSSFKASGNMEPPRKRFSTTAASPRHATQAPTPARPSFLERRNTASSEDTAAPLPDIFSPHRRGPKFVPGGMAETLHKWTIEVGQTALTARRAQLKGAEEFFVMSVSIVDFLSDQESQPVMLSGTVEDGRAVDVLLINAEASETTTAQPAYRRGQILGLREPCWSVTACERQWVVCIDWKVIGP